MQVHATAFKTDIFYIFDQFLLTTVLKPSVYTRCFIRFAILNIKYIQIDTLYAKIKSIWIFKTLTLQQHVGSQFRVRSLQLVLLPLK